MKDITVVILTKNEEKNIEESVVSAKQIANRIIVVDSGSTDNTVRIANECGAEVCFHDWESHAMQFNWALDNCNITTTWVFRLDADERISVELAKEIKFKLSQESSKFVDGYQMRWRVYFMRKWIKHGGTHKPYFLRLFRYGKGRAENKMMDEHIIVDGAVEKLKGDLIHYDYKGLDTWLTKHIWYSNLEIKMFNSINYTDIGDITQTGKHGLYYKLPLFSRAKIYYWYRYYVQLGFLDGKEGKIFFFLQAYWYRFLVDSKIFEESRR